MCLWKYIYIVDGKVGDGFAKFPFVACMLINYIYIYIHTNLMGDTMLSSFLIRFNSDELTC